MDLYTERYLELGSRFYDLFKHDLKNYQNAILMSLDLYEIKKEDKYLEMIKEASYKSLEHIDTIKGIEQFVYCGGKPGFYSFSECIQNVIAAYPDKEFEIIGEDATVFADSAFPKLFDLLIQITLGSESKNHKISFTLSDLQENGVNKCVIEIDIYDFFVPGNIAETILNEDTQSVTGDILSLTFYIAKMIFYRYSGELKLIETNEKHTKLSAVFLKSDNSCFE
ncbi:hypothetical protein LJC08_01455 [Methanimicrococcus sp. OttesenSCG-928-J09]|nr:hypothetical protein [Methanimicrococcus sp. OttesenSCG-928-J09]